MATYKMASQRAIALLLLCLALSSELQVAYSSRLRRQQQPNALHTSHQQERSRKAQAGYGDLDSLLKAIQTGKLDIKDLNVRGPAQTPAQEPQQQPQVPNVVAPAPAPLAPAPVPIVNQPRGSLACSHQYQYGELTRQGIKGSCSILLGYK